MTSIETLAHLVNYLAESSKKDFELYAREMGRYDYMTGWAKGNSEAYETIARHLNNILTETKELQIEMP